MLFAGMALFSPQVHAELVDSVKFVIGDVSVTNPSPELDSIYVECVIYNYVLEGKGVATTTPIKIRGSTITTPFTAKNVVAEKILTTPIDVNRLKMAFYECHLVATSKGTAGTIRFPSKISSYSFSKAVKCIPSEVVSVCEVAGRL